MQVFDGDPARVATVLPGRGYSPDRPLLAALRALLRGRGWTVREVWWDDPPPEGATAVRRVARDALDGVVAGRQLVVAASLGTLAMPLALDRGLAGVWLTPVLTDPVVAAAVRSLAAPSLVVGGTADPYWRGDLARAGRADVLEVPGAGHGLEVPGDRCATGAAAAELVRRATAVVDAVERS